MRTLETNDFMILNTIIYKIYTMENFDNMRQQFLEQMKMILDFDSADFYLASQDDSKQLMCPITYNCDEDLSQLFDEIDYSRGILYSGKGLVYRETDIISDETRVQTEYYRNVYRPNNWHYSLQMILAREKKFLGVVTFYRTIGKDNFQYDDIFLLDMLKDHIAFRLYQNMKNGGCKEEKLTITDATERYDLTKREQTILKLLLEGKDNMEICEEISISINTLKKHILNLYRKLGIKNRVQMFKKIKEKE
ncbi:MAG: LuxR C-terminal-related transcriptional regulator [Lachnospiraceae bacterium]|nr:LuxR C-terminal-related transcriptional regulator [Lachnospiraceae bacterium]